MTTSSGGRTVLLTGASGVVGQALLDRLCRSAAVSEVVCLVHRSPVEGPGVTAVRGDVTAPLLGLDPAGHRELARRVDAVVHCAAVTDFACADGSLEATNVVGTQQTVAFAEAAGAQLYHVSTAFVDTTPGSGIGWTATGYARSKSAAEDVVRASAARQVIVRPSVVIGDSATGRTSAFQGLHQVMAGVLAGMAPIIPFDPSWPLDFVPCDHVAEAIALLVEQEVSSGEYWLTAGEQALPLERVMSVGVEVAAELGVPVDVPRFVPPDTYDRLIAPVFLSELPARLRRGVGRMRELFTVYLQDGATKPSSIPGLVATRGLPPAPDPADCLRASVRYWAETDGYARRQARRRGVA